MPVRPDGLPQPMTAGEFYQRAILDEIRGLRADLGPKAPEPQGETVDLKEPALEEARGGKKKGK